MVGISTAMDHKFTMLAGKILFGTLKSLRFHDHHSILSSVSIVKELIAKISIKEKIVKFPSCLTIN